MATVYCGPYADAIGYDDHAGHAIGETRGYRAECACGWTGALLHPATDAGEESALDEWDGNHLRPMILQEARRYAVPANTLLEFVWELREALTCTTGTERLQDHSRGLVSAAERLELLLGDDLAQISHVGSRA